MQCLIINSAMKKLLKAFEEKDVSTVTDLLIHSDIDPNALIQDKGVTPFHLIVGNQSETFAFKITKIFLRCGGDPNVPSSDGVTPTHVAAAWGRTRILHLLLLNGGDPWIQDDDRKNAFNYAFEEQAWDAIDMLHHFQHVHTASKRDVDAEPKFQIDLERVLLRKGEEMFSYVPDEKETKSTTTQTQEISEKVEIFEKENGWCKDFYQTPCEVLVHSDPKPKEENRRFVTTVEILPKIPPVQKPVQKPEDTRSLLFLELKDAVQKFRSRSKKTGGDSFNISGVEPIKQSSIKEIWIRSDDKSEAELTLDKTVDLCESSLAVTSAYFTCGEDSDCKIIQSPEREIPARQNMSNDSFVSVAEEYRYTDVEEGVVLVEKNLLVNPEISSVEDEDSNSEDSSSILSTVSSVPSAVSYGSDRLRNELTNLGFNPGPIVKTTKKLYLKKLWRLKKNNKDKPKPNPKPLKADIKNSYSPTLERSLKSEKFLEEIPKYVKLEEEMSQSFEGDNSKKRWREGCSKTSFNYLLLDSRVSLNLPKRAGNLTTAEIWECFLSAVFYVGKGKRTRPYAHLYQAVAVWRKNDSDKSDSKTQHIIDIWKDNLGVVCLHVFQNIIPVEAYTREAAMIDAIGLPNLNNLKCGEYYGVASTWAKKNKIQLGVYLLHKAMLIFLNEGERQIRPFDITS